MLTLMLFYHTVAGFNAAAVEGDDNWIMPCLFFYLSSCFCLQWCAVCIYIKAPFLPHQLLHRSGCYACSGPCNGI
jgi:hypothetical protein